MDLDFYNFNVKYVKSLIFLYFHIYFLFQIDNYINLNINDYYLEKIEKSKKLKHKVSEYAI